jgi:hypothetical protein
LAKVKPFTLRIGGEEFTIIFVDSKFWVSQRPSGGWRAHIGKLHKKRPPPTKVIRKSKTCSKCKRPAWTTTSRDRALHASCEGFGDTLPDDVAEQMIFDYAAYAKAQIL